MPFLLGKKKYDLFYHIIDRINNKINVWYTNFLSYAGRLVLLQFVPNSIPAYAMSFTKLPMSCIEKIDSINTKFLWNHNKDGKRKQIKNSLEDCLHS